MEKIHPYHTTTPNYHPLHHHITPHITHPTIYPPYTTVLAIPPRTRHTRDPTPQFAQQSPPIRPFFSQRAPLARIVTSPPHSNFSSQMPARFRVSRTHQSVRNGITAARHWPSLTPCITEGLGLGLRVYREGGRGRGCIDRGNKSDGRTKGSKNVCPSVLSRGQRRRRASNGGRGGRSAGGSDGDRAGDVVAPPLQRPVPQGRSYLFKLRSINPGQLHHPGPCPCPAPCPSPCPPLLSFSAVPNRTQHQHSSEFISHQSHSYVIMVTY